MTPFSSNSSILRKNILKFYMYSKTVVFFYTLLFEYPCGNNFLKLSFAFLLIYIFTCLICNIRNKMNATTHDNVIS